MLLVTPDQKFASFFSISMPILILRTDKARMDITFIDLRPERFLIFIIHD